MKFRLRNTLILAALTGFVSCSFAETAPSTPFAVGVRQYNWMRDSRPITTYVFYPATGTPGGSPVWDAPAAAGVFPIYEYTHGLGGDPRQSTFAPALASAGFIVPAPHFQHNLNDVNSGNTSRDVSQVLTNTLALNTSGPLAGHIRTDIGVGVCGHSMGGMTTHGLLTSWPDSRIISAIPMSCLDMGNPSSAVRAKVMFVHGDQDPTTAYSSGRQAYSEMPAPKAFLTFLGGGHSSFWSDPVFIRTVQEWARWTMYGDTAARDRLASAASASHTKWEFVPGAEETPTIQAESAVIAGGVTIDSNNPGFNGSGFANFPTSGGSLTFNNVNGGGGGTKPLQIRYALGASGTRTGMITVNSVASNITFASTGSWTNWQTLTVNVTLNNSMTNTIRLASTGQDLGNIDQITLPPSHTPDTLQAESGAAAGGVTLDSNNAGFNGTGFANFPTSGGTLTFNNVDGNGGGTKSLAIRYALGSAARAGSLTVNGVTTSITFNPTGSWTTWQTMNVNITLNDNSTNSIRLGSTGQDLGNVDQITVP